MDVAFCFWCCRAWGPKTGQARARPRPGLGRLTTATTPRDRAAARRSQNGPRGVVDGRPCVRTVVDEGCYVRPTPNQVELGCTPRLPATVSQARPGECHFRARPSFGLDIDPDLLKIVEDEASQRQLLRNWRLTCGSAQMDGFAISLASRLRATLEQNELLGSRHVLHGSPGSALSIGQNFNFNGSSESVAAAHTHRPAPLRAGGMSVGRTAPTVAALVESRNRGKPSTARC